MSETEFMCRTRVVPRVAWWARPKGVAAILGAYWLLFALITGALSSAFNIDDEIAAYATQFFALNYSSRNPPLYYWILYGLQQIVEPTPFTFALIRYTLLFLFSWTAYAIARRAIANLQLQAISVYAISLLWLIGYHSHRINTHSDLMIVFIAATVLILLNLRERRSAALYAALGTSIALGILSKLGYLAFLAAAAAGALSVPSYRRVLVDPRIFIAIVFAGLPLTAFFLADEIQNQAYSGTVAHVIVPQVKTVGPALFALAAAWTGYVAPFLPLFLFIVWPWGVHPVDRSGLPIDDARCFLRNMMLAGTLLVCIGVVITGNANIRDRHFHVFYPLLTVYAFAEADRRPINARRLSYFSAVLVSFAVVVASIFAIQRLAPSTALCDLCVQSAPHVQFGRELRALLGSTPTLVTPIDAGQYRINMPAARIIELAGRANPPPPRATSPCVLVWRDQDVPAWLNLLKHAAMQSGVSLQDATRITLPRYAPLSFTTPWLMDFYMLQIPVTSKPCQ